MALRSTRAAYADLRRIPLQPRLGERVPGFGDREVRRILVKNYEIRYEIAGTDLYVLRIFHTRENRQVNVFDAQPSAREAPVRASAVRPA